MNENRIEKKVSLKSSPTRVWKALTDHKEFGQWFGVVFEGPFAVGQKVAGSLTYPGFEHVPFAIDVTVLDLEKRFAFHWHPYALDAAVDYSTETPTLVEFLLAPEGSGTVVTVVESGFEKLPAHRRLEAFRMDEEGWGEQVVNLQKYVG
jgi:uncharacterized protein YndB with AHSA1/START domain